MPDKLTDKEIVKALECCKEFSDCGGCKYGYLRTRNGLCIYTMQKDAIDLINRLQEKIKFTENINHLQMEELQSLKDRNKVLANELANSLQDAENKQTEIERLKKEVYRKALL